MTTLAGILLLAADEPRPDLIDRMLMGQTGYLVFGALGIFMIVAMAYYVWRLGGLVRYLGNPWPSIVIVGAGAVVGFGTFFLAFTLQHPPTPKQIQETESYYETREQLKGDGTLEDKRSYEESVGVIKEDDTAPKKEEQPKSGYNPLNVKRVNGREVLIEGSEGKVWREALVARRHNAMMRAKNTGIFAGLLVVVIGYVIAALRLPVPQYVSYEEETFAPAPGTTAPSPAPSDLKFEESAPPQASSGPAPAPAAATDTVEGVVGEGEDAPVSIDDLEKGYRDYEKRREDLK